MTVLAWDGHTLAADRKATSGSYQFPVSKIRRIGDRLVGYCGEADCGEQVMAWLEDGADPTKYPECQKDKDRWVAMIVICPDGSVLRYEQTPHPIKVLAPFFAAGSGRDYAVSAMHFGKSAREAVEVACIYDPSCGLGVDEMSLRAT